MSPVEVLREARAASVRGGVVDTALELDAGRAPPDELLGGAGSSLKFSRCFTSRRPNSKPESQIPSAIRWAKAVRADSARPRCAAARWMRLGRSYSLA